jgi:ABC-type nitrate/sulfonate/bicarbonate transport system ATPase subunit
MNGTPATIVDEIRIEISRPRTEEDDPSFHHYVKLLYNALEPRKMV